MQAPLPHADLKLRLTDKKKVEKMNGVSFNALLQAIFPCVSPSVGDGYNRLKDPAKTSSDLHIIQRRNQAKAVK